MTKAVSFRDVSTSMVLDILLNIVGPILLLVIFGALLRWRFNVDLATLSKLNIYLFSPGFIFYYVSTSSLDWGQMGGVVLVTVVQAGTLGALVWFIGRALGVGRRTLATVALAVMFYNSGNYGLPLADLAFPHARAGATGKDGPTVQAFVILTQSLLTYTAGTVICAVGGQTGMGRGIIRALRLPIIPVLIAALSARTWLRADASHVLPPLIAVVSKYLAEGTVPIALVTLGAQLASNPRWPRWRPVSFVLVLRLLLGPVQMAAILYAFHRIGTRDMDLWGGPDQILILTAAVPTAVTTLLLALELDGDAALAADCVFWTTVVSTLTITMWLVVIRRCEGRL